ncbi:putative DNA repair protein SWI5 like protein [Glarea lozoyensis 74030]|nr:putative DNA repair protein SWI5 like protein [Glarea lozoyensis 74030]
MSFISGTTIENTPPGLPQPQLTSSMFIDPALKESSNATGVDASNVDTGSEGVEAGGVVGYVPSSPPERPFLEVGLEDTTVIDGSSPQAVGERDVGVDVSMCESRIDERELPALRSADSILRKDFDMSFQRDSAELHAHGGGDTTEDDIPPESEDNETQETLDVGSSLIRENEDLSMIILGYEQNPSVVEVVLSSDVGSEPEEKKNSDSSEVRRNEEFSKIDVDHQHDRPEASMLPTSDADPKSENKRSDPASLVDGERGSLGDALPDDCWAAGGDEEEPDTQPLPTSFKEDESVTSDLPKLVVDNDNEQKSFNRVEIPDSEVSEIGTAPDTETLSIESPIVAEDPKATSARESLALDSNSIRAESVTGASDTNDNATSNVIIGSAPSVEKAAISLAAEAASPKEKSPSISEVESVQADRCVNASLKSQTEEIHVLVKQTPLGTAPIAASPEVPDTLVDKSSAYRVEETHQGKEKSTEKGAEDLEVKETAIEGGVHDNTHHEASTSTTGFASHVDNIKNTIEPCANDKGTKRKASVGSTKVKEIPDSTETASSLKQSSDIGNGRRLENTPSKTQTIEVDDTAKVDAPTKGGIEIPESPVVPAPSSSSSSFQQPSTVADIPPTAPASPVVTRKRSSRPRENNMGTPSKEDTTRLSPTKASQSFGTPPPKKKQKSGSANVGQDETNEEAEENDVVKSKDDILMDELKAIKVASIQARNSSLETEIAKVRAQLEKVTAELEQPAAETVKTHIHLLHQYNDIRDIGQGLIGMIADNRGVRIGELYEEFGVGLQD